MLDHELKLLRDELSTMCKGLTDDKREELETKIAYYHIQRKKNLKDWEDNIDNISNRIDEILKED